MAASKDLILIQCWQRPSNGTIRSQIMMILLLSAINLFKFSLFGVFLCCTDSEEESESEIDIRGQDKPYLVSSGLLGSASCSRMAKHFQIF